MLLSAAALAYANLLWLLACLPLVTAPAATCALYQAVDAWRSDHETPTVRAYARGVREHFTSGLLVGLPLGLVAAVLAADLYAIGHMGTWRRPMLVGWLAVTVSFLLLTAFTAPALASDRRRPLAALRASAHAAIARPAAAAAAVVTLACGAGLVMTAPLAVLIVGSAAMWVLRELWRWAQPPRTVESDDTTLPADRGVR
ncbi:MAG: DUF624 domain-containing protein [Micromonosporaceae bacterium]